jgi:hypothetical protein
MRGDLGWVSGEGYSAAIVAVSVAVQDAAVESVAFDGVQAAVPNVELPLVKVTVP